MVTWTNAGMDHNVSFEDGSFTMPVVAELVQLVGVAHISARREPSSTSASSMRPT